MSIPKKQRCVVGHTNHSLHNPLRESYLPPSPRTVHPVPSAIVALQSTQTLSGRSVSQMNSSRASRLSLTIGSSQPSAGAAIQASPRRVGEDEDHRERRAALKKSCEESKVDGMRALLFDQPSGHTIAAAVLLPQLPTPTTRFSSRRDRDTFPLVAAESGTSSFAEVDQRFHSQRHTFCAPTVGTSDVASARALLGAKANRARELQQRQADSIRLKDETDTQRDLERIAAKASLQQQYAAGAASHK